LLSHREHLRLAFEAPGRAQHQALAALVVPLLGEAQLVLRGQHLAFAVAALAIEIMKDDTLRLRVVAVERLAAVRRALAREGVLVVQELAVIRPFEAVTIPATALGEFAFPTMTRKPRQWCKRCIRSPHRRGWQRKRKQDHGSHSHI
jgi:hypothetical protein